MTSRENLKISVRMNNHLAKVGHSGSGTSDSTGNFTIANVLQLKLPLRNALPLLLDSPHSGIHYPDDFGYALPWETLRQLEDSFVNELYGIAPQCGATWLEALFARSYIDLNRNANDIDPELLDAPYPGAQPGLNSRLGSGLLWRLLTTGEPLYDRRLSVAEVTARIEHYYRPYHQLLLQELQRLHREFGQVWHINCHSMPNVSGAMSLDYMAGIARPDFVLGDHNGASCEPDFIRLVHKILTGMGYAVSENKPYKGQELTAAYAKPALGFNSLQIEVNRRLYMNEKTREKHQDFNALRINLETLITRVAEFVADRVASGVCVA